MPFVAWCHCTRCRLLGALVQRFDVRLTSPGGRLTDLKGYASITASTDGCAGSRDADGGCEPGGLIPSPGSIRRKKGKSTTW
jgi:hypothetical protein